MVNPDSVTGRLVVAVDGGGMRAALLCIRRRSLQLVATGNRCCSILCARVVWRVMRRNLSFGCSRSSFVIDFVSLLGRLFMGSLVKCLNAYLSTFLRHSCHLGSSSNYLQI